MFLSQSVRAVISARQCSPMAALKTLVLEPLPALPKRNSQIASLKARPATLQQFLSLAQASALYLAAKSSCVKPFETVPPTDQPFVFDDGPSFWHPATMLELWMTVRMNHEVRANLRRCPCVMARILKLSLAIV